MFNSIRFKKIFLHKNKINLISFMSNKLNNDKKILIRKFFKCKSIEINLIKKTNFKIILQKNKYKILK